MHLCASQQQQQQQQQHQQKEQQQQQQQQFNYDAMTFQNILQSNQMVLNFNCVKNNVYFCDSVAAFLSVHCRIAT